MFQIKRVYDKPSENDGYRVLIDKLWPRGMSKERAVIDLWLKEIAPSSELRDWFGHRPERFEVFNEKYIDELSNNSAIEKLEKLAVRYKKVTLLYAAKDPFINHAVVLQRFLAMKR